MGSGVMFELQLREVQPEVVADSLWLKRPSATLIGLVAMFAILLAGAGIYSVMSYSVSQRRKAGGPGSPSLQPELPLSQAALSLQGRLCPQGARESRVDAFARSEPGKD